MAEESRQMRFEATVHAAGVEPAAMSVRVAGLDLDRLPDPEGRVRVLVSPEECASLLDQGFELHLHVAVPVRPLDPKLILDDDAVRRWFEERTGGLRDNEPA